VLYCSTHCEALHELERYDARVKRERHALMPRSAELTEYPCGISLKYS